MFVFQRSFWAVAAGLGSALAIVALTVLLDEAGTKATRPAHVPSQAEASSLLTHPVAELSDRQDRLMTNDGSMTRGSR
ncbi:MAG: hypothetical protein IRZ28_00060 [Steroidobacteraceae bacterium]|nr:hypothetical protein [Steroidobacteraceae bacterium]